MDGGPPGFTRERAKHIIVGPFSWGRAHWQGSESQDECPGRGAKFQTPPSDADPKFQTPPSDTEPKVPDATE